MTPRPLRLELAPSLPLAAAIVASHAVAGACAALVVDGAAAAALAAAIAAFGLSAAWSRALHRAPHSVRAMEIEGARVTLCLRSGERIPADVGARRHVGRHMLTLPIRRPRRRTLLITADMLPADSFRALRVWALWGRLPPVAAEQLPA